MTLTVQKPKGHLRILFWNVQDWRYNDGSTTSAQRMMRILKVLKREKPDIALFAEVSDPSIKNALATSLRTPHIAFETADKNRMHLMAVFRAAAGNAVTIEQRNEFSDDTLTKRTYPLLRVATPAGGLAILAVHTKSGSKPEAMSQRQTQFGQIANLAVEVGAHGMPVLVMGDMNSMGNGADVDGRREIDIMGKIIAQGGLTILPKDKATTWRGIGKDAHYPDADLDHVFLTRSAAHRASTVRVGGWPHRPTPRGRDRWVREYSDHAYLVVDIAPQVV